MDRKDWFDWQDFRANPKNTLEHKEYILSIFLIATICRAPVNLSLP